MRAGSEGLDWYEVYHGQLGARTAGPIPQCVKGHAEIKGNGEAGELAGG